VNAKAEQIIVAEQRLRDREAADYYRINADLEWGLRVVDASFQECLKLGPHHTVLDAGCGTGRNLPWLSTTADRVIAVDHSAKSLEMARAHVPDSEDARVDFRVADLRRIPIADASVDRLLCVGVIQHIPGNDNRLTIAREFHRVLRPGGVAAVAAYRWLGIIRRQKEGYHENGPYRYAFTVREFARLFEEAGFSDVRVGGAGVLRTLSETLNVSVETQRRLVFTPVGRNLGHYVIACVRKRGSLA
jgi:SAM-dependent methyltransferase